MTNIMVHVRNKDDDTNWKDRNYGSIPWWMVMIAYQAIIILMTVSIDMPTNLPLFKQPPKFETVLYNTNKIKSLESPL